jgi:GNAT superfamily N-acetyltransferase
MKWNKHVPGHCSMTREGSDLRCSFRIGRPTDALKLEWNGAFTAHRQIIAEAFESHARGDGLVLVGVVCGFPVAQLWVKLAGGSVPRFWALRVMGGFQGLGLGTRLLRFGERSLVSRSHGVCEIGVERSNAAARRLYERLGYRTSYQQLETYCYGTPWGEVRSGVADQWILQKRLHRAAVREITPLLEAAE